MPIVRVPPPWYAWGRPVLVVAALLAAAVALLLFSSRAAEAQTSTCGPDTHQPDFDPQVLVGTTATRMPQLCGRRGVHVLNLGPNPIWCTTTGLSKWARVGKSLRVGNGEGFGLDATDKNPIWCIAETAAQVDGAATVLTEMR